MNNVSCRLWGKCWGDPAAPVRLVVKWAGLQVFDGAVPTSGDEPDARQTNQHGVLCTWTVDNVTPGLTPVEITVHNGSASVNNILLNNIVPSRYVHFKPELADLSNIYYPQLPRSDVNVLIYTDQEFLSLYGFPKDAPPNYVEYVDVAAADTWVDGNFNHRMYNGTYTDGKLNATLNGVACYVPNSKPSTEHTIEVLQELGLPNSAIQTAVEHGPVAGNRNYFFKNGDTLRFDYLIEWDIA
jgi:hypothetical protein